MFLFGVPFYKTSIDKNKYNKNKIVRDITHNYKIDTKRNEWDKGWGAFSDLHHSYFDNDNKKFKKIKYEELVPHYENEIKNFLSAYLDCNYQFEFRIENYTCMSKNQYMKEHDHPYCEFNGVHYLKFDEKEHQPTMYTNPNHWANYAERIFSKDLFRCIDSSNLKNSWLYSTYKIDVKEDDFVITPSSLRHYVPSQKSDKLRMTIALNISIINKIKK